MPQLIKMTSVILAKLDQVYGASNDAVKEKHCLNFSVAEIKCQICRFYDDNGTCSYWASVFGKELQAQLWDFINLSVKVTPRFYELWYSRKVEIPAKQVQMAAISHGSDVKAIARGGVKTSSVHVVSVVNVNGKG